MSQKKSLEMSSETSVSAEIVVALRDFRADMQALRLQLTNLNITCNSLLDLLAELDMDPTLFEADG